MKSLSHRLNHSLTRRFKCLQTSVLATGLSAAVALGTFAISPSVHADALEDIE
ncbi:MAG: amino acid ABC transporter substrate-binding protein, partial [Gammaproteobacteria bacterium]|nr:amino acid ABC transporter substrate-binding protein [Gammaproteobacteria bacterium]